MKDEILKLRPMGVDGCLMTGAIQDHFVGFRLMTILAGQSYISEVNIFCCDVKAEEQIISLILLSKLRNFLLLLQFSLSPLEVEQRTILFSFRKLRKFCLISLSLLGFTGRMAPTPTTWDLSSLLLKTCSEYPSMWWRPPTTLLILSPITPTRGLQSLLL